MKILLFVLISSTCYAQKVLRVTNENKLEDLIFKRGNRMICPVNDGNGDLILPVSVLTDTTFSDLVPQITAITQEVDYVPFPADEAGVQAKIAEFNANGKAIKIDPVNEEVEHKGKKIKIDKKPKPKTANAKDPDTKFVKDKQ
jgi:hypothetical protein